MLRLNLKRLSSEFELQRESNPHLPTIVKIAPSKVLIQDAFVVHAVHWDFPVRAHAKALGIRKWALLSQTF